MHRLKIKLTPLSKGFYAIATTLLVVGIVGYQPGMIILYIIVGFMYAFTTHDAHIDYIKELKGQNG